MNYTIKAEGAEVKMRILYYSWEENSKIDMLEALSVSGHEVSLITAPINNYLEQPELETVIRNAALESHCDIIFSFNYFPFVSNAASSAKVPYVSWVYDCPHWALFSPTITNPYNYLFLFDRVLVEQVRSNGVSHAYHLPLAVNTRRLQSLLEQSSNYSEDISFVGSLYENNTFRQIQYLPEELHGYIDGLFAAQKQIWGQDLIAELITPEFSHELGLYIKCQNNPLCPIPKRAFFLSMLQTELTSQERIEYLNALGSSFDVSLYSASNPSLCPKAFHKGTAHYTTEMPFVFACSKINLNLTLRSITSGIPLRALDIMGCGGFLLSNYQPELDEYFSNGCEYVYFENKEDFLSKCDYYLSHPKERAEIAANGLFRVTTDFSYEHQISQMFSFL